MTGAGSTVARSLRISAEDARRRFESGAANTVLDVRQPKAWDSSDLKIPGATRMPPDEFGVDAHWSKDQLILVY